MEEFGRHVYRGKHPDVGAKSLKRVCMTVTGVRSREWLPAPVEEKL